MSERKQYEIPLVWESLDELPTIYANHIYITHAGGEFYLIFGEQKTPVLLNLSKENIPESVGIKPVAKVVLAPDAMLRIVEAINVNVGKYLEKVSETESE